MILTAIGPPLLAGNFWAAQWLGAHPFVLTVAAGIGAMAAWIIGPIAWWRELVYWVCGPDLFRPTGRRIRRKVRVRIERYAGGST